MSFNPYDQDRMIIDSSEIINENYKSNLMNEYSIKLGFFEYDDCKQIFISKSRTKLYFPKFNNDQSNYKCLLEQDFDKFILILQNIRPDLIYLNEPIQVHFKDGIQNNANDIYLPKINILENQKSLLPKLIIIPIDIRYSVNGHKNVIIINTRIQTITFFEPYGVDTTQVKNNILFNILEKYYTQLFPNYIFINASYPVYNVHNKMEIDVKDVDFVDLYEDYYRKIKEYKNTLSNIHLLPNASNEKKKIKKQIKKIRKKINSLKMKKDKDVDMDIDVQVKRDFFTFKGPQKIQEQIEFFGNDGIGGHCVGWSLYIVFLTFINVNLFQSTLKQNISISSFICNLLLEKINGDSLKPETLSNMIRHFIEYVYNFNKINSHLILSKAKPSKVVHIIFNTNGDFKVVSPSDIIDKVPPFLAFHI